MKLLKKIAVILLKKIELGSAVAVRLTKLTGKSKEPIHPKHFLTSNPWYSTYINNSDTVLDLGCGNGQAALKIAMFAKKVVGVDIGQSLLEIAQKSAQRRKIANVQFKPGNLEETLKFKDSSFDKMLFLDVLEHLKNRDQALKEIKRVLKPNGLLFLGVPNSATSWKKLQRSVGICSYSDPDHKIEFSEKSIRDLLEKYHFKIIDFGYGKFDTLFRGLFDIIGAISLPLYKKISNWRQNKTLTNPVEASGFEIVAQNTK